MFVNCLNPIVIVNPALPQLLATFKNYYLNGRYGFCEHPQTVLYNRHSLKLFYSAKHSVTKDNIENYYVCDDAGYKYPIYLLAKCNHCILCNDAGKNVHASRMMVEAQLYNTRPWFVTLTYDDVHLPSNGVNVEDVQLFLKRFRQNIIRHYKSHKRFRYFLCSEYGQDPRFTLRPHYHAIFFNLDTHNSSDFYKMRSLLRRSWSKGITDSSVIDMSKPNALYYTSKYSCKEIAVPDGKNPTFTLSSRRNGGIGSEFYRRYAHSIQREPNPQPLYCDRFTGKVKPLLLSRYALHYMLPSLSESIPLRLRNKIQSFSELFTYYRFHKDFNDTYADFYQYLSDTFHDYLTLHVATHVNPVPPTATVYNYLTHVKCDILYYLQNHDLNQLKLIHYVRKDVLQKLTSSVTELTDEQLRHKANLIQERTLKKQLQKKLHYVN